MQKQLRLACSGVKARVAKEQSSTGIKDSYTQYWIDKLLERVQAMKNEGMDAAVEAGRIRASRSGTGCRLSRSVRDTYVSAARLIIPDD